jgi:hypothetical protein
MRKHDSYFGENGFVDWLIKKKEYTIVSDWETPFLKMVDNDEEKALQKYFKLLELYKIKNMHVE